MSQWFGWRLALIGAWLSAPERRRLRSSHTVAHTLFRCAGYDWQNQRMTNPAVAPAFTFGPHSIDPAARKLLNDGQPVKLGARAFDVLVALIERRDRVMTKNELLDVVWPGLVVEETRRGAAFGAAARRVASAPQY